MSYTPCMTIVDLIARTPPAAYAALIGVPLACATLVACLALRLLERLAGRMWGGRCR